MSGLRVERYGDGEQRLVVSGELDLAGVRHVDEAADAACGAAPGRLVIDLRGLEWMDSAGRAAIARAVRVCDAQGYDVSLLRPRSPEVRRVMQITGLDTGLPFVPDAE